MFQNIKWQKDSVDIKLSKMVHSHIKDLISAKILDNKIQDLTFP